MKNALILHGTLDTPSANWFPWLATQLEKKGYKVWVPDLPRADSPSIPRYNKFIFEQWKFDNESVLIGHSSGAVAILGILQELPEDVVVDTAILVAGFKDDLDWDPTRELFRYEFDFNKIKSRCKKFILIHSDNDPFVSLEHGEFLHEKLGGEFVIMPGQMHFSVSSMGQQYKEFPELLKYI